MRDGGRVATGLEFSDLEGTARRLLDAAAEAPALLTLDRSAGVQVVGTPRREVATAIVERADAMA